MTHRNGPRWRWVAITGVGNAPRFVRGRCKHVAGCGRPGEQSANTLDVLAQRAGILEGVTITEFLTACLDEDEALARAASVGTWHIETTYGLSRLEAADRAVGLTGADEPDLHHITRHDPAHVLHQIETNRRLISEWLKNEEHIRENARKFDDLTRASRRDHAAIRKTKTIGWHLHGRREALGLALVALAETYSDRPGWRKKWQLGTGSAARVATRSGMMAG